MGESPREGNAHGRITAYPRGASQPLLCLPLTSINHIMALEALDLVAQPSLFGPETYLTK